MGSAGVIDATIASLQRRGNNALREIIVDDEEWTRLGLRAFKTRLENCERDATRQWLEIQRVVDGDMARVLRAWLAGQGVESVELAQQLLAMARRAVDSSDRDAFTVAKELVRKRVMADPDERRRVMQEIFGIMPADVVATDAPAISQDASVQP